MQNKINELNLVVVDTHGFNVDFEKYDIVDFTGVEVDDIFYKNKWVAISAEKKLMDALNRGYGVFCNGKVYYSVNLVPEVINDKKKSFENYISNMLYNANLDRYGIQEYLLSPSHEQLVKNAMLFYDRGFDIEFVKNKLSGRVKDVDAFIQYLESRKSRAVS